MTIKYEEIETITNVVAPTIAALALSATTSQYQSTDTFTGVEFQAAFDAQVERIADGFKDALNSVEGAIEEPAVPDFLKALGLGDVLAGLESSPFE
jgi:hypothetical protein